MLRCVVAPALLALCSALPLAASAQVQRQFPPHALRGEITGTAVPEVLLNGRASRLAPGARIRGVENRFELINHLAGRKQVVHYTTDSGGLLLEIWVLTPAELANQPWPSTVEEAAKWTFDPVAQKWSRR